MTAIATAQAGDVEQTATWTGGVIPGDGDTVTIDHAVDQTADWTIGHSPQEDDATQAILVNDAGSLTTKAGKTLTCRGDFFIGKTTYELEANGTLQFDASVASTPSTAIYKFVPGLVNNSQAALFKISGTLGNRCTFRSVQANGAANANVNAVGLTQLGPCQWSYCQVEDIGGASTDAINFWPPGTVVNDFKLDNVIFDRSGRVNTFTNLTADQVWSITNCTFRNGLDATWDIRAIWSTTPTGARTFTGNCLDRSPDIRGLNTVCTGNIFGALVNTIQGPFTAFEDNVMIVPNANNSYGGKNKNFYFVANHVLVNPHGVHVGSTLNEATIIENGIFEYGGTDPNGDWLILKNPNVAQTLKMRHILIIPTSVDNTAGSLMTGQGGVNGTYELTHCTTLGLAAVGEAYDGHLDMISKYQDTIHWDFPGTNRYPKLKNLDGTILDVLDPDGNLGNVGLNYLEGSNGNGYENHNTSSTLGLTDVDEDPVFADRSRNMKTWDLSLGGPGTLANAITELKKRNDPAGFNSRRTHADLMYHVRAGFRPRNRKLENAGETGLTRGALDMAPRKDAALLGCG